MCVCVCVSDWQVSEQKKQVEQIRLQQRDSLVMDDDIGDQGDMTFRVGGPTSSSNHKQKEKIRQIERQRKETNDVSFVPY